MVDDNPLLQGAPTWADAYSYNANRLSNWLTQQRQISADRGLWNDQTGLPTGAGIVNAGQQYGNALLMGTTAPAPLRAWHGSMEDFDAFDPAKVGSGPMGNRWAKGTQHADEYYLTTNPEHAETYGPVVQEYQINQPLMQKDAKAELETWAKDQGYDSAQQHLDDYYEGNIYSALDLDNYLKDALTEAKQKGFPGVHVSLGDLKTTTGNRRTPVGDFIVLHDPTVAT